MPIDLDNLTPIAKGVGRRKEAVAFVSIYEKNDSNQPILLTNRELRDQMFLNGQSAAIYFQYDSKKVEKICLPFEIIASNKNIVLDVGVKGGGLNGQVEATRLAVSRALSKLKIENRIALKATGFLTRDSRIKESKKYGLKKARKASQFSKL